MSANTVGGVRSFARKWGFITLVVVIVLGASVAYVARLRLSHVPDRAIGHAPPRPEVGQPRQKVIDYTLTGSPGERLTVSYLQPNGDVSATHVQLPWKLTIRTRAFTLPLSVLAQSRTGNPLACGITVNGIQRATEQASGPGVTVNCSVAAA